MKTEVQVRLLQQLMDHLDHDTNVDAGGMVRNPVETYTSPDMLRREWESFFRGYPQIIGLSGDLPTPGTFLTTSDFGVPVLATRDREGDFHAMVNVCRHRGVIVEGHARGTGSRFTCPFHNWTYSEVGDLVGVPKESHFGDFDHECRGLVRLPAVEAYGLLWVHPDPNGTIDPEALLGGLADEMTSWDFGSYQRIADDTYDMALNWKLAMDTFGETYHFNALHRNTLAQNFYGNVQCYDTFDRNHRMVLCLRAIDELRDKPTSDWSITAGSFPVYYLWPNVQINVGDGAIIVVRAYPDPHDPGRSTSQISYYLSPAFVPNDDADPAGIAQIFGSIVRDEDYATAELQQIGARTGMNDTVLFGRNEPALHHYHNTYRRVLGLEPLELVEA